MRAPTRLGSVAAIRTVTYNQATTTMCMAEGAMCGHNSSERRQ
jgi:hypothetical protein